MIVDGAFPAELGRKYRIFLSHVRYLPVATVFFHFLARLFNYRIKEFLQFVRHLQLAKLAEGPRVRDLVKQTAEAYRTLVEHVAAHASLAPLSEYTLFRHHFNENVEHFNQIVARRRPTPEPPADEPTASPVEAEETMGE